MQSPCVTMSPCQMQVTLVNFRASWTPYKAAESQFFFTVTLIVTYVMCVATVLCVIFGCVTVCS